MSCHDIGRGMNNVVKNVLNLFDEGKIDVFAARRIIAVARRSVYWCDGNEGEAIAVMYKCRCGKCLQEFKENQMYFDIYDLFGYSTSEGDKIEQLLDSNETKDPLATWEICDDCFDGVIEETFHGEQDPVKLKETYISKYLNK